MKGFLNEDDGASLFCWDCDQEVRTNEYHDCTTTPIEVLDPDTHNRRETI